MPGDTLVITSAADSLRLYDSLNQAQQAALPHNPAIDDTTGFFFFIGFLTCVAGIPFLINWIWGKYLRNQSYKQAAAALHANYNQYDELLAGYNGYYKGLSADLRRRFLERVARFTATKTIHCVNLPHDARMPLLLGLRLYKLVLDWINICSIFSTAFTS